MSESYQSVIHGAADYVRARISAKPEVGLVPGSGWGGLARTVEKTVWIPQGEVLGFPIFSAAGHAGAH